MTKEEELRAEVEALREAVRVATNANQNLEIEIGRVRAELDNVQDRRGAPTIGEVLTEDGFDRLAAAFPHGLRASQHPLNPTETAISVIWALVRQIGKKDKMIDEERELVTETQYAYSVVTDRAMQMALRMSRMTNALAEYAMRATEQGLHGAPTPVEDDE